MKMKICGILFCMLMITNIYPCIASAELPIPIELPDQQQKTPGAGGWYVNEAWEVAQSFIPSKGVLSQISLYIREVGEVDWDITISIREELLGEDIASITENAYMLIDDPPYEWIIFDFPNINVIPGETYYIVASADNGSQDNSYSWIRNEDDLYPDGEVYGAERGTNEWELREGDCCFVTYSPLAKEKTYNSIPRVIVWLFERFPFLQPYFSN